MAQLTALRQPSLKAAPEHEQPVTLRTALPSTDWEPSLSSLSSNGLRPRDSQSGCWCFQLIAETAFAGVANEKLITPYIFRNNLHKHPYRHRVSYRLSWIFLASRSGPYLWLTGIARRSKASTVLQGIGARTVRQRIVRLFRRQPTKSPLYEEGPPQCIQ